MICLVAGFVSCNLNMPKEKNTSFQTLTVEKQVETDFFRMVAAYISKWAPYDFPDLIRDYLSKSDADEKIKAQVKAMYL